MKKSIILSAAMAAMGAMAGSALAQTSVTIYGLVDAGIVLERGGASGNINKLTGGVQNGSRLGFKGTEELGAGMSAKFVLESGFTTDTGASAQGGLLFGRQAFVGLGAPWGELLLGRQYTPHYLALVEADPFGAGLAGDALNLIRTTTRADNTVKYVLPNMQGVNGELSYSFGEVAGNNTAGRRIGGSIGYANGPVSVKLAHLNTKNSPIANDTQKDTILMGKWNFGVATANLAFNNERGFGAIKAREYLAGVSVPFGPSTLIGSYIRKDDRTVGNADAHQWGLGYTYAFSRRTNLYTSYARITNKAGATNTVRNASETGSGDKAFNVGVRHLF